MTALPGRGEVLDAAKAVAGVARRTPLVDVDDAHLKLESLQRLGSFKLRGAWNRVSRLAPSERAAGVTCVSAGNHGLAVAWCARRLGVPCLVRVPEGAVERKVRAIEAQGATVEALPVARVRQILSEPYAGPEVLVHPFGDPVVVAGAGTVALEIAQDLPDLASVVVPMGGGGLAAGTSAALEGSRAQVYGVAAEGASALTRALDAGGAIVEAPPPRTIADGLAAPATTPAIARHLHETLADWWTVSDDEIRAAMRALARDARVVAEPAGAAAYAGFLAHARELPKPCAVIVSGSNVDPALFADVVAA